MARNRRTRRPDTDFDDELDLEQDDFDDEPDDEDEPNSGETAAFWKRRFQGLQKAMAKKDRRIQRLSESLDDLQVKYEEDVANLTTERATLTTERDTLKKANGEMLKKSTARDRRDKVAATIRDAKNEDGSRRFPRHMAELFADGLMPGYEGLEDDALLTKLDSFRDRLDGYGQQAVNEHLEGSAPPPPSGSARQPATLTSDQMYERLMTLDPDDPEYKKLEDQYYEAVASQQK